MTDYDLTNHLEDFSCWTVAGPRSFSHRTPDSPSEYRSDDSAAFPSSPLTRPPQTPPFGIVALRADTTPQTPTVDTPPAPPPTVIDLDDDFRPLPPAIAKPKAVLPAFVPRVTLRLAIRPPITKKTILPTPRLRPAPRAQPPRAAFPRFTVAPKSDAPNTPKKVGNTHRILGKTVSRQNIPAPRATPSSHRASASTTIPPQRTLLPIDDRSSQHLLRTATYKEAKRNPKPKTPTRSFDCTLCRKSAKTRAQFLAHIDSEKHKRRVRNHQVELNCRPCDRSFVSIEDYTRHIKSAKHRERVGLGVNH